MKATIHIYLKEKRDRHERELAKYNQEQKKLKQLETAAKRMHEWAQRADNEAMHKRAFNIEKRIERMEKTDKPVSERSINSGFSEYSFSGKEMIYVQGLSKRYEGKRVLNGLNFHVQKNERIAILGDNGSGKSTLIKILTGETEPDEGITKIGESVRYTYLPQIVTFENTKLSILETVIQELQLQEGQARNLLAKYNFRQEDVHKTVENLSGGEKSRLRLCIMMQKDVNLLLLDEPTNHLDIYSREWLENALEDFSGTLVFVSHDRYFINKFGSRISEMVDGRIEDYYGNYEYYKEKKKFRQLEKIKPQGKEEKKPREKAVTNNKDVFNREKAKGDTEALISELEAKLTSIEKDMEDCAEDFEALNSLYNKKIEVESELEALYERWLTLNDLQ